MAGAVGPKRSQRIVPGAPQHGEIRPQREGAQDIQPAVDATVEDQRQIGGGPDRGQHIQRRRRCIELAPCVRRDPKRVDTRLGQRCRILGAQHALDHQRSVPVIAQPVQVRPVRRGAQQVAHMRRGIAARHVLGVGLQRAHARHAPGPQPGQRPARRQRALQRKARGQPRRLDQPAAQDALAPRGNGNVHRQHKRGKPVVPGTPQHVQPDLGITGGIKLEPTLAAGLGADVLDRGGGDRRHPVGNFQIPPGARQKFFGIRPDQSRGAHRRDAKGQCVAFVQQRRVQIRRDFTMQDRRGKQHGIETGPQPCVRRLGPCRAVQVLPDEMRQARAGSLAQVGNGGETAVSIHDGIWREPVPPVQCLQCRVRFEPG